MATRLAGGLIKWTVNKLSALLAPLELSNAASEDLERLERTMKRIQSTLLEAPKGSMLDRSEKHRLEELRKVAYDAEDLVEEYAYEVLHAKIQARNELGAKVTTDLSSILVSVPVPEEMALRAKVIRERFDEIVGEWDKLRWGQNDGVKRPSFDTVTRPPTSSLVYEPSIHGRHQDKEKVIAILLNYPSDGGKNPNAPCVLPIVGMGGVGKTTLAQLVYNDPRMDSYFDLKGWIYVSKEFNVQTLTQVIFTSLTKKPCKMMQLDLLHRDIEEKIKGKKLLLVLDDVWNERHSLWHDLQIPLFCSQSCKILVTTRNKKVAKIMQTIPFYPLRCLELEDSWQLFKQVAFENQDPHEYSNLLEIGREITEKCGGLPLAIRAIGCALRLEPGEESWQAILGSDLWELEAGMNEVLPALQLSYDCMPENLQECFMSLSLFPKGCAFSKDRTIRFWSFLGFLNLESRRSAEDIGNQYFADLHQRSLLQLIQDDEQTCFFFMHDFVQKLAEFVAGVSFRKLNSESLNLSNDKGCQYLSVLVNELPNSVDLNLIQQSSSLRALQIFNTVNQWLGKDISINLNEGFFQNLRSLRVLNFNNTGISTLPSSIGSLKQLRFLGLARTKIKSLPESIGFLYNLKTMDLSSCHLQELPKGIKNLVNLQHLIVEKWSNICMPSGISCLTNLELLPVFNIGIGSDCEISEMGKLSKLRGSLRISGLNNVRHLMDIVLADLFNKQHIHVLVLDWSQGVPQTGNNSTMLVSDDHGRVLEFLQPQQNLLELEIYHYPGLSYPKWLGDSSYSRLGKVVLFGNQIISCRFLPPLGRLPSLRDLSIQCMLTVELVGYEFCDHDGPNIAFPSLKTLEFKYMPRWVQWFGVRYRDFCSLKTLKIVSCNALHLMPEHLSYSLEKLVLNHCSKLASVPTITSLTTLILMGDIDKSLLTNVTLPQLKSLQIGFSQNTQYVMLGSMLSLEVLVIKGCKNLKSLFGLTGLVFLRELELDECPSLILPLDERIPFFTTLRVTNCPKLCYWKLYQMKVYEDESDSLLEAFGDADTSKFEGYDNYTLDEFIRTDCGKTVSSSNRKNNELQTALPIVGDDYNLDWLFSVTRKNKEHGIGDQLPTSSRKRLWNGSMKWPADISDKGKQICDDSSGTSIASASDSELGSFGGTSEEGWS